MAASASMDWNPPPTISRTPAKKLRSAAHEGDIWCSLVTMAATLSQAVSVHLPIEWRVGAEIRNSAVGRDPRIRADYSAGFPWAEHRLATFAGYCQVRDLATGGTRVTFSILGRDSS